jgi:hypothetical protein
MIWKTTCTARRTRAKRVSSEHRKALNLDGRRQHSPNQPAHSKGMGPQGKVAPGENLQTDFVRPGRNQPPYFGGAMSTQLRVGDEVALAGRTATVQAFGPCNKRGVRWVEITLAGNQARWVLEDRIRRHCEPFLGVCPPHGLAVLVRPGCEPEIVRLPYSRASEKAVQIFADVVLRMWRSHYQRAWNRHEVA